MLKTSIFLFGGGGGLEFLCFDKLTSLTMTFLPLSHATDKIMFHVTVQIIHLLSYDVAPGSEITPCNKIDKPLVVYRFVGNVMTSITTLCT